LRTVFLGTSEFAAGVLTRLVRSEHSPALAVTRPDRPKGRGRRLASPPVALSAQALGVPVAQPQSVNAPEAVAQIDAIEPQSVVVCAFGALIREPLLSSHQMLNVHPSLLPRWRGAAPVERAIIAGDERTGVSIMRLTEGLDSGPVCLVGEERIDAEDDYGSLAQRLCRLGGELIVQALDRIQAGDPPTFVEQDEAGATYAEKIGPQDRLLRGDRPAAELERLVRALRPHVGARLALPDGSTLGVWRAKAAPDGALTRRDENARGTAAVPTRDVAGELAAGEPHAPAPGTLAQRDGRLLYRAADGALELLQVQPPGGRAMDAQAYLRGHAL
jgi:methionyl-tRNA formyltransferase